MNKVYYEVLMKTHVGTDFERRENVYVRGDGLNDSNLSDRFQKVMFHSQFVEENGHSKVIEFSKLTDEGVSKSLDYKAVSIWEI